MKKSILISVLILFAFALSFSKYTLAEDATEEAENILDKIKEKVEAIRKNPKAYIGSVTDKTESSLQIKDTDGTIQQISVKESTTFVKNGKTESSIKFSDIAIGDFIVAMGLISGNILEAERILLTSPIEEPNRKIVFGKISGIGRREITVLGSNQNEEVLSFPSRWKGADTNEMEEENLVLAVTTVEEGKSLVRTIEIIVTEPSPTPAEESTTN